jgi:enamine deaminase RidA (YjgF/YER057c/UK114 family)
MSVPDPFCDIGINLYCAASLQRRFVSCQGNSSRRGRISNPRLALAAPCESANSSLSPGTAPIAAAGGTASPGDVYGQTMRCLEIVGKAVAEAGGTIANIIRTRIMLTDISGWHDAARAHGEVFRDIRPACTFVQVSGFIDPTWLVEIEADCVVE